MLKILGSILIGLGSAGLGTAFLIDMKKRLWHLEYMKKICMKLESDIRYCHSTIPAACRNMGNTVESPYKEFFQDVYKRIHLNAGESFSSIWKEETDKLFNLLPLKKEEFLVFQDFLGGGSNPDIRLQEDTIRGQMDKLDELSSHLKNEILTKGKIYTSMGVICGLLIIIVLL